MTDPTVPLALRDRPLADPVGTLVADAIVLWRRLLDTRPDLAGAPGTLHVTLDSEHGTLLVCLSQPDGRMRLVERLGADPRDVATFGLPLELAPTTPTATSTRQTH